MKLKPFKRLVFEEQVQNCDHKMAIPVILFIVICLVNSMQEFHQGPCTGQVGRL